MTERFDPAPAARLLADAWRTGRLLVELPAQCRPRNLAEGYDVQDHLIDVIGDRVVGWKLGVGSVKAKAMAGLDRGIVGCLLASRLFHDGDRVPMPNAAPVTVEFEIAVVLNRTIEPSEPMPAPIDVVGRAHVAFELVHARYVDRRAAGWPSFAADNAGFGALVLGPVVDFGRVDAIRASVEVAQNGASRAVQSTGDDRVDPLIGLGDLLAHARDRNIVLPQGAIVSTGTLTQPFSTTGQAAAITATFDGGVLRAQIAPTC